MPKVVGYTAPWLSRPAPGSRIFSDPSPPSPTSPSKQRAPFSNGPGPAEYQGPRRLVARRGTEIFTVVGNKIRWANLSTVKDSWTENSQTWKGKSKSGLSTGADDEKTAPTEYRTLSAPVYYQIRQLVISPSGVFLAICTEHTVHIAVLPDSSRLSDRERSPLKLKTYQLGPTTHVIPESPIVSALWHPLALSTSSADCFVTVTAEAAVRVWELDRSSRASFERPALAIDLKRLVDGVSSDEDFEPSGFGKSRGFSVDAFDMEASAACFGGQAREEENAWASMTLWTTMRNGDVYALCPLLPANWQPTPTTIPSLATSVVSNRVSLESSNPTPDEERAAKQQYEWVQELDENEPVNAILHEGDTEREVRLRPTNPGAIPRLQGPFEMLLSDEFEDLEVSDIHVFAAQLDEADFMSGEDEFTEGQDGLPFTLVCLATTDGTVHVAMDMEVVSGQWLPRKGHNSFNVPVSDVQELVVVDSISGSDISKEDLVSSWPVFTPDPNASYGVYLTTSKQVSSYSFSDWTSRLSMDLLTPSIDDNGLSIRLQTTCQTQICNHDEILNIMDASSPAEEIDSLTAPVVFEDPDLGYMLLTATASQAYTVSFDTSHLDSIDFYPSNSNCSPTALFASTIPNSPPPVPQRAPYAPPSTLYKSATAPLKDYLTMNVPRRQKMTLTQPIRLSPATLDVMTSAHRLLAQQTSVLEKSAAELFRRCERIREELGDQVKQMAELADKIQHLGGGEGEGSYEERINKARRRQGELLRRFEEVRRKSGRVVTGGKRDLSEKELGWIGEVEKLGRVVGVNVVSFNDEIPGRSGNWEGGGLRRRFEEVKQIAQELVEDSAKIAKEGESGKSEVGVLSDGASLQLSSRLQKSKLADAMSMVEREGAVIEAVMARLERLNMDYST